ncbi:GSCFA family protein [Tenacibaculum sp. MAR_2009_124]|uniref:GSCFA domain-containing protein n=1 Tax=Tenacibaculum sp. MAR_2009_124 TaxID=1250059 RepID=UPI000895C80E|nr:GSCFA domain-containing protein [Tenacibaculum sp. MAR_2009_124]SED18382.1 GSCFA family protein [Tenacibaculum sp. MAR_2009_124]
MILQTQIPLQQQQYNPITYQSKLLLLGSCFSENIGNKLSYFKFQTVQNPFGILFQPKAIENLVLDAINQKVYKENDILFHNEQWHSFNAHSKLSSPTKERLLDNLNEAITLTQNSLNNASHIIVTLGTAWVYRFIEKDQLVANCHKVPQKKFLKEILSINEIKESLDALTSLIRSENSKTSIIFTLSPVRHLKDGFIENQRSKAHLLSAIHKVVDERKNIHYFPSYEIMMDELRDYRFYKEDMIHPNNVAINYIWERFKNVWISEDTQATMKTVDTIQKGLAHKPFNPESDQHKVFLKKLSDKLKNIQQHFPSIKF